MYDKSENELVIVVVYIYSKCKQSECNGIPG
jgi:hypothetical protein